METRALTITSPAFRNEGNIPAKYTCFGDGVSPPLHIEGIPDGTVSLALKMEDPDAPDRELEGHIIAQGSIMGAAISAADFKS